MSVLSSIAVSSDVGTPTLLRVENVTLQYKTRDQLITATHGVSFDVQRNDRFVLLGPSGCGKSSLLKSVAGFVEPVAGQICLDGQLVREPGPDRMMVFQEFDQLMPWKTVIGNIMFPMQVSARFPREEIAERAARAIPTSCPGG